MTLTIQKNSNDKSIWADVSVIRYRNETGKADNITRIPSVVYLTDPSTKTDSPSTQAMLQTMAKKNNSIDPSKVQS